MNSANAKLTVGSLALVAAMGTWEGANQLKVYSDKLAYGIATVCKGHTGKDLQGNILKVGTPYSSQECEKIDQYNAIKYSTAILMCVKAKISQPMFDSLSLFAINVGIRGACGSRAVELINEGRLTKGCKAIATKTNGTPVWSFSGGKYRQGLQNRRMYERDWCLSGVKHV